MNICRGSRLARRLAVVPAIVVACGVAGGALAPAAGAAGLGAGSWTTPMANATVSGAAVSLQFATNDSTVTFVLPYGTEDATVSGGVATGTFDSTRVLDGQVKLGASECNVLGQCDEVDETVTVSNPVPPTPAPTSPPTFSPLSGATVDNGSTVLVSGSGSTEIHAYINGQNIASSAVTVTLPYSFIAAAPPSSAPGTYQYLISVGPTSSSMPGADASYSLVVADTTPPVISGLKYPTTYFPVRDGFLDHFFAEFTVNEASTAVLAMYKSGKVVSSGTVPVRTTAQVDLRAGDRLKAGTYQWQLTVTDLAGNVTKTPMRSVKADGRHLINNKATVTVSAASAFYKSFSGSCSSATKSGTSVIVSSLSKCHSASDQYFDIAEGRFLPVVKDAIDYGSVTVTVVSKGTGLLTALNIGTEEFLSAKKLNNGTTTLKLNDEFVGYPRPELIMDVIALGGHSVTVSSISISYVYKTLSKK